MWGEEAHFSVIIEFVFIWQIVGRLLIAFHLANEYLEVKKKILLTYHKVFFRHTYVQGICTLVILISKIIEGWKKQNIYINFKYKYTEYKSISRLSIKILSSVEYKGTIFDWLVVPADYWYIQ